MDRMIAMAAAAFGFLAVALGAFGAHGLEGRFSGLEDGARRMEWWQTAAHYHLTHALALAFAAWLAHRGAGGAATASGAGFALGILLFSGSLYAMSLTGTRWLGAITPIGGLLLLGGWVAAFVAAFRLRGG